MNKVIRKQLATYSDVLTRYTEDALAGYSAKERVAAKEYMSILAVELDNIADGEQAKFDYGSESWQASEKGQAFQDAAESLYAAATAADCAGLMDTAHDDWPGDFSTLAEEVIDSIEEVL